MNFGAAECTHSYLATQKVFILKFGKFNQTKYNITKNELP